MPDRQKATPPSRKLRAVSLLVKSPVKPAGRKALSAEIPTLSKAVAALAGRSASAHPLLKLPLVSAVPPVFGLVPFSYQNVAYQIDLAKSKVYRQFIEVEKSRTNSILSAFQAVQTRPPRPTL